MSLCRQGPSHFGVCGSHTTNFRASFLKSVGSAGNPGAGGSLGTAEPAGRRATLPFRSARLGSHETTHAAVDESDALRSGIKWCSKPTTDPLTTHWLPPRTAYVTG